MQEDFLRVHTVLTSCTVYKQAMENKVFGSTFMKISVGYYYEARCAPALVYVYEDINYLMAAAALTRKKRRQ